MPEYEIRYREQLENDSDTPQVPGKVAPGEKTTNNGKNAMETEMEKDRRAWPLTENKCNFRLDTRDRPAVSPSRLDDEVNSAYAPAMSSREKIQ